MEGDAGDNHGVLHRFTAHWLVDDESSDCIEGPQHISSLLLLMHYFFASGNYIIFGIRRCNIAECLYVLLQREWLFFLYELLTTCAGEANRESAIIIFH
jgi:hypothetical protein